MQLDLNPRYMYSITVYVCITLVLETPSGGSQMGLQKEREEEKDISGVKYLFYTTGSSGQAVEIGFLDLG